MKDMIFDSFQNDVNESLLRHKSILDIMTKLNESNSRVNRALAKSVTNCGCIKINASKQNLFADEAKLNSSLSTHIDGKLCDNCREVIENELGTNIFYLTSLCNCLDLNLYDILLKEENKINILGKYTLR
ncbi:DUF1573 domain-containing protein [Clostridium sp. Sa3CUN1]|uniref:DUF1573 domain-containing protein n=1 Tax=Clostridium gallinarum TaxID=2762246 RepID=A0ABR8Q1M9_9CLOT|nr:DUF1573 domain-containing protein [Clostridium gallinarum]MBD7914323.1 DUF1573 domain-containing protein [Clostridium gallinarum]